MITRRYYEYTRRNGSIYRSDLYEKVQDRIQSDWPEAKEIVDWKECGQYSEWFKGGYLVATVRIVYK